MVSATDAAMVYEASRLAIEEAQVWPDGVASAQTAALARVTWLKANGYTELAADLKALANQ
ncbi:MAG: hypothetical protein IH974_06590 [Myxococcales bacterium]|nr:hypothetical protein [Myxococcales bacterium]